MSVVDVATSVDIRLEALASLEKSSSVPSMVFRTVAKDDSKSIEVLIAAVPSAVTGAVTAGGALPGADPAADDRVEVNLHRSYLGLVVLVAAEVPDIEDCEVDDGSDSEVA